MAWLTLLHQNYCLSGDKKTDVRCLKPPSLWHFVIGALYGNTDTMKIPKQILCLKAPLDPYMKILLSDNVGKKT